MILLENSHVIFLVSVHFVVVYMCGVNIFASILCVVMLAAIDLCSYNFLFSLINIDSIQVCEPSIIKEEIK